MYESTSRKVVQSSELNRRMREIRKQAWYGVILAVFFLFSVRTNTSFEKEGRGKPRVMNKPERKADAANSLPSCHNHSTKYEDWRWLWPEILTKIVRSPDCLPPTDFGLDLIQGRSGDDTLARLPGWYLAADTTVPMTDNTDRSLPSLQRVIGGHCAVFSLFSFFFSPLAVVG